MNASAAFPLITLQPVMDAKNAWIALLLEGDIPFDSTSLGHLLGEPTLAELLASIDWIAAIDLTGTDAALDAALPPALRQHLLTGPVPGAVMVINSATSPAVPTPKGDPTTRALLLKMLSLVTTDADSADIEALIKRDTNLSYHLLKLVNSVAFSPGKKITNFSQAIAMIGRRQLQRWLQLLLYARSQGSTVASPLMPRAALRASLMENLAKRKGLSRDLQDHAFMTGMFSLLDLLFGSPLAGIIAPLNLSEDVVQALTTGNGQFGNLLAAVKANEGPPTPALAAALIAAGIAHTDWASALAAAMHWAVQISKEA
jgi:hypothetical protein